METLILIKISSTLSMFTLKLSFLKVIMINLLYQLQPNLGWMSPYLPCHLIQEMMFASWKTELCVFFTSLIQPQVLTRILLTSWKNFKIISLTRSLVVLNLLLPSLTRHKSLNSLAFLEFNNTHKLLFLTQANVKDISSTKAITQLIHYKRVSKLS